jgi:hypothetical protein
MRLSLTLLLFLVACTKPEETPPDDYVLIEFASKLEEANKSEQSDNELKKN